MRSGWRGELSAVFVITLDGTRQRCTTQLPAARHRGIRQAARGPKLYTRSALQAWA